MRYIGILSIVFPAAAVGFLTGRLGLSAIPFTLPAVLILFFAGIALIRRSSVKQKLSVEDEMIKQSENRSGRKDFPERGDSIQSCLSTLETLQKRLSRFSIK